MNFHNRTWKAIRGKCCWPFLLGLLKHIQAACCVCFLPVKDLLTKHENYEILCQKFHWIQKSFSHFVTHDLNLWWKWLGIFWFTALKSMHDKHKRAGFYIILFETEFSMREKETNPFMSIDRKSQRRWLKTYCREASVLSRFPRTCHSKRWRWVLQKRKIIHVFTTNWL